MKKKQYVVLLMLSMIFCIFTGCGKNFTNEAETKINIAEEDVIDENIVEDDLSGIVPLSKRINKGKLIAFGCMGDLHNGCVYKIFFFNHGKVTVVSSLEPIGEYGGFELASLEGLSTKSEEELWELCDDFKKNSEEFVQALKTNNENAFYRLTDPNSPDFDLSFSEAVKSQPDSGYIYNIILPVIDAPFVISIESDETNSIVSLEQVVIATQRVSKTYGGTMSIDGEIDGDFYLTNMAEGGEAEIGDKMYSVYPAFESNIAYICVESGTGFYVDSLDTSNTSNTSNTYINNKEMAYDDASKLLVK